MLKTAIRKGEKVLRKIGIGRIGVFIDIDELQTYESLVEQIEGNEESSFKILHTAHGAKVFVIDSKEKWEAIKKNHTNCVVIRLADNKEGKTALCEKEKIRYFRTTSGLAVLFFAFDNAIGFFKLKKAKFNPSKN